MEKLSTYILEKLRVTKGLNYGFTWNDFIDALYKHEDGAFWLEDLPYISGYNDLPEFVHDTKTVKAIALVMYDYHMENKTLDLLYSPDETSVRKGMTIHNMEELSCIIEPELITEIYNIISK